MSKREQEFDEKIRKKLSEAPDDFDEGAWAKMEQKLSADASGKRRILPLWWLRGAAALILLGLGLWAYMGLFQKPEPAGERQITREVPEEQPDGQTGDLPPSSSGPSSSDTGESRGDIAEEGDGRGNIAAEAGGRGNVAGRGENGGNLPGDTETAIPSTIPDRSEKTVFERPYLEESFAGAGQALRVRDASIDPSLSARPSPGWPSQKNLAAVRPEPGTAEPEAEEPGGSKVSFSLGVLAAPDLNAVKSFDKGRVGFNTGLSLGIHFNDRLSLHTGVVYSKKPYDARPADYHINRQIPDLVNIAANCDVIDIPLNLHYAFYKKGKNSIGVSAGLSSYLMLREKYRYEYGSYDPREYEYINENKHFMGVANAGVVFERKLNDKMSLGIQPFIKVPLTGIGHGNVKLISTGAAIQLNLNLNKK